MVVVVKSWRPSSAKQERPVRKRMPYADCRAKHKKGKPSLPFVSFQTKTEEKSDGRKD